MKKIFFILSFLCTAVMINAQGVSVSGSVTDANGGAISGATILIDDVSGNSAGASITDMSGNYYWTDTVGAFPIGVAGTVNVSTIDCNNNILSQTHTYTPNLAPIIANFISCTNPTGGSCSVTMTTPVITGSSVTAAATISGGVAPYTYSWDMGDSTIYNTQTVNHNYNTPNGSFLACVTITDANGCTNTVCEPVIFGNPTGGSCSVTMTTPVITGSSVTATATISGGVAPYTYSWDMGDSTIYNTQTVNHNYNTSNGSFLACVTITDANGCTSTVCEPVIFGSSGLGHISGNLYKNAAAGIIGDGEVYLIEYDSINGTLTAIDTVMTQQGMYSFQNVPMGAYLVKGALLTSDVDYANYLPTYFVQALTWTNGQYVGPSPANLPAFVDIELVAGNNPGGPGFIGGLVVNGAGRPVNGGVTLVEDILNSEPMEGVSVLLLDANNNAVAHTVTASDGSYSFNNIAMGTYNVHVEEVGKTTYPATITIDANNLSSNNVHFTVHESMVTLTGTYAVVNVEDFQVFPNPVRNTATIQLELTKSMDLTLTVKNLMGQEYINQQLSLNTGDNSFPVEMSDLPKGIYLVSLKSATDVITYKIQKM